MRHSKRYNSNFEKINREKEYSLEAAAELLVNLSHPKFDESVEIAINLGVDPKHADQIVRGTVALPNGIGKDIKVLVFARDDLAEEARNSGADFVGADDMVEKVKGGWTDIDVVVAAPDMMAEVGKLGKILGPRGLMPNPKIGTVTKDIAKAVTEVKAGKIEFRVEKNGIIHNSIGKVSFSKEKIVENAKVFLGAILKARPQAAKGLYMKKITMTSTMGPGIKLDRSSISG
ncbi:MAG: 50S ribosomal protein L1 [Candidatus Marinimicrobia bacterium]|nr:50S ribosomal protein L1 [Candidatus Neomarinimicrobiota bacterium]